MPATLIRAAGNPKGVYTRLIHPPFSPPEGCVLNLPLWETELSFNAIDVGNAASDRATTIAAGSTYVDLANAANETGYIDSVEIWAATTLAGCRVGTFYLVSGAIYRCRDSVSLGAVTSGSKQTFTGLGLRVIEGDYIGCFFDSGTLDSASSGGSGVISAGGDNAIMPGVQTTFTADTGSNDIISLYASGTLRSRDSNRHALTVTGALWTPQGRSFDGDDLMTLNDNSTGSPLNFTSGDFSLELWFQTTNLTANNMILFRMPLSNEAGWYLYVLANGRLSLRTAQAGPTLQSTTSSVGAIVTNTKYHIAATRSGATGRLFINGVEASYSAQGSHNNPVSTAAATIIANNGATVYLTGAVGEVRCYERALTPGEIQRIYEMTKWMYQ